MHLYLYDSFLYTQNYSKKLDKVEARLTDLGLGGVSIVVDSSEKTTLLVEKELRQGVGTIIIVGNDNTVMNSINVIAAINPNILRLNNIAIALIPFGGTDNEIANMLGIGAEEKACEVLAQRRLLGVDLGSVNGEMLFVKNATIECLNTVRLSVDDDFELDAVAGSRISIYNLPSFGEKAVAAGSKLHGSISDGIFDIIIEGPVPRWRFFKKASKSTIIKGKRINIEGAENIGIDGFLNFKNPRCVKNIKHRIDFVVGKNRGV